MKLIRAGAGLGDSLYLQSVVRHLVNRGERLEVRSDWPDVFRPLGVTVAPFTRVGVNIIAHYTTRKQIAGTDQFQDMCLAAGIREPAELRLDWKPTGSDLIDRVRQSGKPVVCVLIAREPMDRKDGFGTELLPKMAAIQAAINGLRGSAYLAQIGSGRALHRFDGIDLDLSNQTTVSELIDLASIASGFIGYVSFIVPLAESFDKPVLCVWARRGLLSRKPFISSIKPEKIFHKPTSMYVMDDWNEEQTRKTLDAFHIAARSGIAVQGAERGDSRERAWRTG